MFEVSSWFCNVERVCLTLVHYSAWNGVGKWVETGEIWEVGRGSSSFILFRWQRQTKMNWKIGWVKMGTGLNMTMDLP